MRRLGLAFASFVLLSSCNDYLFEQKCAQQIKEQSIVQPAVKPSPADILFVVDNSGSMADEQLNLARNFTAFIEQIAGAVDYQIMVVSTDTLTDEGEMGGLLESLYFDDETVTLRDFDRDQCKPVNLEHGCARGPDPATRIIKSSELTDPAAQVAAFQANVVVGSCGHGTERGLAAMKMALQKSQSGGCNAGFLRDGANLVVVIVSDEQDQDDLPVEQYVTDLGGFGKSFAKIRVATVVGSADGEAANCRIENGVASATCGSLCMNRPAEGSHAACTFGSCGTHEFCDGISSTQPMGTCQNESLRWWDLPDACRSCSYYKVGDCCSALNGSRYVDFARRVEGRVTNEVTGIPQTSCTGKMNGRDVPIACLVDSICQESFSTTLARIARELISRSTFTLTPAPVFPDGVVVKVKNGRFPAEGKQLVLGTDFTIEGTLLTLLGANVPVEGEDIEIYYVVDKDADTPGVGACAQP